ncbi:hypothetical protein KRR38_24365 [Novosphingobium sp. G106]|uniref:hypothetical protein n=1 Tax=Novosphingobium sp. G106 TaxID=2849500 RepID=UPI001C2D9880|nr:hypothetical protein [Novosphingobium sp. G106]MBV1690726.1 hypothetical protein [Novosphingobium sp. G106]
MNSHRLTLILAGAVAVVVIAAATVMAHHAVVPAPVFGAMLLVVYGLGLGLGRLVWNRGG